MLILNQVGQPQRMNRQRLRMRGVTSIEYGLIASLIALAIVGAVSALGDANALNWSTMAEKVLAALGG